MLLLSRRAEVASKAGRLGDDDSTGHGSPYLLSVVQVVTMLYTERQHRLEEPFGWGRRWTMQLGQRYITCRNYSNCVTFRVVDKYLSVTFRDIPSRRTGQQLIAVVRNIEADTVGERLTHLQLV